MITSLQANNSTCAQKSISFRTNWFLIAIFVLTGYQSTSQTIQVSNVSPATVCAGSTVDISFVAVNGIGSANHFNAGTQFQVYLSNSTGNSFTAIGSAVTATGNY